jgi:hypothetical protein
MWTEEKIKQVIAIKEEAVVATKARIAETKVWRESGLRMKSPEFVKAADEEKEEAECKLALLEEQIKVLTAVLDIRK